MVVSPLKMCFSNTKHNHGLPYSMDKNDKLFTENSGSGAHAQTNGHEIGIECKTVVDFSYRCGHKGVAPSPPSALHLGRSEANNCS